jgi:CubicO group peptidase (beta-lactamase class C family)
MLLLALRSLLEPIVADAIAQSVTPGAVVLVSEGGAVVCHEAFGTLEPGGVPVQTSTIYDAASVTKAAVTSCLLMGLVADEQISLETPIAPLLPGFEGKGKDAIQLRHLLGHASGLPAHLHFFEKIRGGDLMGATGPRDALFQMAAQTPLSYATGSQTIYSDLGYILLCRLIENLMQMGLDEAFEKEIAQPLQMRASGFINLLDGSSFQEKQRLIAPTTQLETGLLLRGEVHDDNCHSGGGICGHAGLFTTASDLARLAQVLLDSASGRNDYLPSKVVRSFWNTKAAPNTTWRMGWDTPSGEAGTSHSGDLWPTSGVGHLGFTGTAWWLSPEQNRFVIILTNRVYFPNEKQGIKNLRRALMHAICRELDG